MKGIRIRNKKCREGKLDEKWVKGEKAREEKVKEGSL